MTKYLDPSFSVCVGGDATYRENWDRIFAKKPEPELRTTPAGEPGEAGTSLPNASVTRSAICGALIGPEGEHCCVPAPCPEHQIPRAGPTPCVDPYAECSLCGTFHYNRNVRKCEDRTWNHTFTTRRVDLIDSAIAKIAALPEAAASLAKPGRPIRTCVRPASDTSCPWTRCSRLRSSHANRTQYAQSATLPIAAGKPTVLDVAQKKSVSLRLFKPTSQSNSVSRYVSPPLRLFGDQLVGFRVSNGLHDDANQCCNQRLS